MSRLCEISNSAEECPVLAYQLTTYVQRWMDGEWQTIDDGTYYFCEKHVPNTYPVIVKQEEEETI